MVVVRHTPGVTGFIGAGNHPLPITDSEIDEILVKIGEKEAAPAPKVEIDCESATASAWRPAL